jgi:hypothetical protein
LVQVSEPRVFDSQSVTDEAYMTDWTVMAYISADDVLANFAVESLKQLKRAAGDGVLVVAQFEASQERDVHQLAFDGNGNSNPSIESGKIGSIPHPVDMADPQTLTDFIDRASNEYAARHYCLILWGHGYELLLEDDRASNAKNQSNGSGTRYLTTANLRKALESTQLAKQGKKLDILGIDACSLSLVEVATEIQNQVDFMIASQEEVPDASFPYEELLLRLRDKNRDDVKGICATIPKLYKQAYQDYLVAPGTGMKEITLSSLNLEKISAITDPLKKLADALLSSTSDSALRNAIMEARRDARDFALGLFVDLSDFCHQLSTQNIPNHELKSACREVIDSISADGKDSCVIANQTGEKQKKRCHGISVYFPYLADGEDERLRKSMVAGRTSLIDQLPLLVKGGTNILRKARSGTIRELEADFKHLRQFEDTNWNKFIAQGWSLILAKEVPQELDLRYSAQQCALNLLSLYEQRKPAIIPKTTEMGTRLTGGPEYREQPRAG